YIFFFFSYRHPRYLHSFPTRRSSDLLALDVFEGPQPGNRARRAGGRCADVLCKILRLQKVRPRTPGAARNAGKNHSALERVSQLDRKSTRLNSSHVAISYAVFCLKKK